jgi:RimJ/RimL family protein N-acetyltransferase
LGKALCSALFELLRRQGYINAYAGITLPNPASVRLHESLGFVPVGSYPRAGFIFGCRKAFPPIAEPLRSTELFDDEGIKAILDTCAQAVRLE